MRNDIYTINLQQLFDNFLSHTRIIFLFSLYLFLSLLILTNQNRKNKVVKEVVHKKLYKYYSSKNIFTFSFKYILFI